MMMILYPFRLTPLLLTLVTSFTIWLLLRDIFSFLVLLYGWPLVITAIAYFKYLFVILERTANGHADSPVLTVEFYQPFNEMRPYQLLLLVLFVVSLSGLLSQHALDFLAIPLIVICTCFLPAFIGLLGIHNGFYASLNPITMLRFMHRIGIEYLAILALLAIGLGLIVLLHRSQTGLFTSIYITLYAVVLIFLWIGKIIHARREALGYRPDKSPEREAEKAAETLLHQRKHKLERIYKERRRENVLAVLLAHIEAEQDRLAAHAWYHAQMMQWDHRRLAIRHAEFYIRALREAGKHIIADLIQQECRAADPDAARE